MMAIYDKSKRQTHTIEFSLLANIFVIILHNHWMGYKCTIFFSPKTEIKSFFLENPFSQLVRKLSWGNIICFSIIYLMTWTLRVIMLIVQLNLTCALNGMHIYFNDNKLPFQAILLYNKCNWFSIFIWFFCITIIFIVLYCNYDCLSKLTSI